MKECFGCGDNIKKAWRRYRAKLYCQKCYSREFKNRQCPWCNKLKVLPIFDAEAVCRSCEHKRPCIRCHKPAKKIGIITEKGPVCNCCYYYFSKHVTSSAFHKKYQGTCSKCHRYRQVVLDNGLKICKKCKTQGDVPCPVCGNKMPAGRGDKCESCYWESLFEKRLLINRTALFDSPLEDSFERFSLWLKRKKGTRIAAIKLNNFLPFFLDVHAKWASIPSYSELILHFGGEYLRRVRTVINWLKESSTIVIRNEELTRCTEERRISSILDRNISEAFNKSIFFYHQQLKNKLKVQKTTLRSIRLALRPASNYLSSVASKNEHICQETLNYYLKKHPGQRAAISGFVCFLRENSFLVVLPKRGKRSSKHIRALENKLLKEFRGTPENENVINWIHLGLKYFHGIKSKDIKKIPNDCIFRVKDGWNITIGTAVYWLPSYEYLKESLLIRL